MTLGAVRQNDIAKTDLQGRIEERQRADVQPPATDDRKGQNFDDQ